MCDRKQKILRYILPSLLAAPRNENIIGRFYVGFIFTAKGISAPSIRSLICGNTDSQESLTETLSAPFETKVASQTKLAVDQSWPSYNKFKGEFQIYLALL